MSSSCESCLMPFAKDPGTRENARYCSLCFQGGKLSYEGNDLREFQKVCRQSMINRGMHPWVAAFYTWCIRFAPRWKRAR